MDNAAIIGYGVVGKATADIFGIKKHYDINPEKSNITLGTAAKCRYAFICLPTALDADGRYHLDDIVSIIKRLEELGANCLYIIRSTVAPGFALHLQEELGIDRIISNPEFLTESTAEKDSRFPSFILLGGIVPRYLEELKAVYEGRIKAAPVILTDNTTAELAKLSLNAFFATKVIYANQIYDFARKLGANYEIIRRVLEGHPFGSKNHFQVWFKGKRGIHGKCLPKDARALGNYSASELIQKVNQLNETYIYLKEDENL